VQQPDPHLSQDADLLRSCNIAIPFNLAIDRSVAGSDAIGRPAHFVQVTWKEE